METLQKQTSQFIEDKLTYLPEGSLVNLFPQQESEKEKKMTVISGRKCYEQFGRFSPLGLLVKMLLESSVWYSRAVKLRWKVKPLSLKRITRKQYSTRNMSSKPSALILSERDIPSSRYLFQLAVSELPIEGTGCGLLPTITNSMATEQDFVQAKYHSSKRPPYAEALLPTPRASKITGTDREDFSPSLPGLMNKGLLPTPSVSDSEGSPKRPETISQGKNGNYYRTADGTGVRYGAKLNDVASLLPTPATRDIKGANSAEHFEKTGQRHMTQLPNALKHGHGINGQLNPRFVAELMGYNPGYLEL